MLHQRLCIAPADLQSPPAILSIAIHGPHTHLPWPLTPPTLLSGPLPGMVTCSTSNASNSTNVSESFADHGAWWTPSPGISIAPVCFIHRLVLQCWGLTQGPKCAREVPLKTPLPQFTALVICMCLYAYFLSFSWVYVPLRKGTCVFCHQFSIVSVLTNICWVPK